jgi:hypothetical protein
MNENVQGNKGIKRKIKQQQGKKQKYKKGNQQYRKKKGEEKTHYANNDSQKEADHVQAEN